MPRNRGLLDLRAVNSEKNVLGANNAASLTMRTLAADSVPEVTAVTLPGTSFTSTGSFCAVTITGGSVTRGCGGGVCAMAASGPAPAVNTIETKESRRTRNAIDPMMPPIIVYRATSFQTGPPKSNR